MYLGEEVRTGLVVYRSVGGVSKSCVFVSLLLIGVRG